MVWGVGRERLEVRREEGGEERERGTGNHRYVQDGGWVAWRERTEKKWDCGGVKEQRLMGRTTEEGNTLTCVGSPTSVLLIEL